MDTIYIIDNSFVFNSSVHTLQRIEGKETVNLAVSASLCFTLLLEKQGEIILRHELLEKVWGSRGMNVTTNTLYQNISLLRKSLSRLGIDTSMIQTAPRRGFLFDKNIDVKKKSEGIKKHSDIIVTPPIIEKSSTEQYETVTSTHTTTLPKEKKPILTIMEYKKLLLGGAFVFLLLIAIIISSHAKKLDDFLDTHETFTSANGCITYASTAYPTGKDYIGNINDDNNLCDDRHITAIAKHHPIPPVSTIPCQYPLSLNYWPDCTPSPYF